MTGTVRDFPKGKFTIIRATLLPTPSLYPQNVEIFNNDRDCQETQAVNVSVCCIGLVYTIGNDVKMCYHKSYHV